MNSVFSHCVFQDSDAVLNGLKPWCRFQHRLKTVVRCCTGFVLCCLGCGVLLYSSLIFADALTVTGSNDFSEIYGRLVGWIKGDLGRTLSISFVLIGLAYGMARNSLIGFATGVGAAVGLQVTPTIINSIFGL